MNKGGGLFDFFTKSETDNAIKTEKNLLDLQAKYTEAKKAYDTVYDKHLANLLTIGEMNGIGSSLVDLFNGIVFPNDIQGKVEYDYENPLLLKNYLLADKKDSVKFRKEHIRQQILYQINKLHPNDIKLIKGVDISMNNKKINIGFVAYNNRQFDRSVSISDNYIINIPELLEKIKDVIIIIKKTETILKPVKKFKNNNFTIKNNKVIVPGATNVNSKLKTKKNNKSKKNNITSTRMEIQIPETDKKQKNTLGDILEKVKDKPVELPTGENAPLSKQQILQFQHQQTLNPDIEIKNNGSKQRVYNNKLSDELKELLGIGQNKKTNKKSFYDNIPLEKLTQLDFTKITDKSDLDTICERLSDKEEDCKKIDKCWYNPKGEPKCYRFKTKNEI